MPVNLGKMLTDALPLHMSVIGERGLPVAWSPSPLYILCLQEAAASLLPEYLDPRMLAGVGGTASFCRFSVLMLSNLASDSWRTLAGVGLEQICSRLLRCHLWLSHLTPK